MEQPLPQCWSTSSVPRAFFLRVAIGCRLSLKIDRNLSPFWAGGLIRGYTIWYDMNRRYGIWRIFIQICGDGNDNHLSGSLNDDVGCGWIPPPDLLAQISCLCLRIRRCFTFNKWISKFSQFYDFVMSVLPEKHRFRY